MGHTSKCFAENISNYCIHLVQLYIHKVHFKVDICTYMYHGNHNSLHILHTFCCHRRRKQLVCRCCSDIHVHTPVLSSYMHRKCNSYAQYVIIYAEWCMHVFMYVSIYLCVHVYMYVCMYSTVLLKNLQYGFTCRLTSIRTYIKVSDSTTASVFQWQPHNVNKGT